MKAKVIIQNGETEIILIPENEFEKEIIERSSGNLKQSEIKTTVTTKYNYSSHSDHKITINITEVIK